MNCIISLEKKDNVKGFRNPVRAERIKKYYRQFGYTVEQDFPSEYYFMYNSLTGECVRLYYNGRVEEYHK